MRPGKLVDILFLKMKRNPDTIPVLVLTIYSQDMSHEHLTTVLSLYQDRESAFCKIMSLHVSLYVQVASDLTICWRNSNFSNNFFTLFKLRVCYMGVGSSILCRSRAALQVFVKM